MEGGRGRGGGHRPQLGQLLTGQPHGHRTDRLYVDVAGITSKAPYLLDDPGGVGHRIGIGHGAYGGEASERGGRAARGDCLRVFSTGLA